MPEDHWEDNSKLLSVPLRFVLRLLNFLTVLYTCTYNEKETIIISGKHSEARELEKFGMHNAPIKGKKDTGKLRANYLTILCEQMTGKELDVTMNE